MDRKLSMIKYLTAIAATILVSCVSVKDTSQQFDVAIVPGCPTQLDGHLTECQWARVGWGAYLINSGVVKNIIVSGGAPYTPYIESESMAEGLIALGVPRKNIFVERISLHTDENVKYSLLLCDNLGFKKIAMASDAAQAINMAIMGKRWHYDSIAIPLDHNIVRHLVPVERPNVQIKNIPYEEWIDNHRNPKMVSHIQSNRIWHYIRYGLPEFIFRDHP